MSQEAKKTEDLIHIYKEDAVKENLNALIHQVQRTVFLIPAMMPKDVDVEELKKKAQTEKVMLPKEARPIPCLLKNSEGVTYLPMYTKKEEIPAEPKYDILLNLPFHACLTFALNPSMNMEGMAMNPFSDNLLLKKKLLEMIQKNNEERAKALKEAQENGTLPKPGAKQVKVTPDQYRIMMRQKAEFHDMPLRMFKEKNTFMEKLCDEKESFVNELYAGAYSQRELYPYKESDFEVMALNINADLLLVRLDAPAISAPVPMCLRIYFTQNPNTDEVHYFYIETGKEKDVKTLCEIDAEGKRAAHGEAPVEGAEIQRIIDLLTAGKTTTS